VEEFGDPRHYNVKWMTLLEEFHGEQKAFGSIY
jgi:hypothetical protein